MVLTRIENIKGLPPAVGELVEKLSRLPGIGPKSALRIALHLLRSNPTEREELAQSILAMTHRVKFCSQCWTLSEVDPCPICSDTQRDQGIICVVEEPGDIPLIERTGAWKGLYHVLGGALSPLDGIGPDQLHLKELETRVKSGEVREVVVATNPTPEGEATALYISQILRPAGISVTRIARGVPVGSDLEFIDEKTLQEAFKGRRQLE